MHQFRCRGSATLHCVTAGRLSDLHLHVADWKRTEKANRSAAARFDSVGLLGRSRGSGGGWIRLQRQSAGSPTIFTPLADGSRCCSLVGDRLRRDGVRLKTGWVSLSRISRHPRPASKLFGSHGPTVPVNAIHRAAQHCTQLHCTPLHSRLGCRPFSRRRLHVDAQR